MVEILAVVRSRCQYDSRHGYLTAAAVARTIGIVQGAMTHTAVVNQYNVHGVISKAITRNQQTVPMTERPRTGLLRMTTTREDRFLAKPARRSRLTTARSLQNTQQRVAGNRVSKKTVRNRLNAEGMWSRRPVQCMTLTALHPQQRMICSNQHCNWRVNRWRHVLFTDESRYCLDFNDGRARVWRNTKERNDNYTKAEHDRFKTEAWCCGLASRLAEEPIVWSSDGVPWLAYVTEMILSHLPWMITHVHLENNITPMDRPARSPDLSPIEHTWDILWRRVYGHNVQTQTLDQP